MENEQYPEAGQNTQHKFEFLALNYFYIKIRYVDLEQPTI